MTTLVVGTAATWAMVGLIWMVQLVQYPMLATYSVLAPGAAAGEHQRRITLVVGPLMAVEGVTALILLVDRPEGMAASSAWMAALLLARAWIHDPGPSSPPCSPGRGRRQPSGSTADHHQLGPHCRLDDARPGVGLGAGHLRILFTETDDTSL